MNEPVDEILRVLSDGDRRLAVRTLAASETPLALSALASRLADARGEPTADKPIQIRLHHRHLPMLDDIGFVDYDAVRGTVSLTKRGEYVDDVWLGFAEELSDDLARAA